ncbi:MAG: RsmE family RNA methyltransferase [Gammaproteobacteria bacterium]
MRLIRLYIDQDLDIKKIFFLDKNSHHYLSNVLRVKKNQKIILFNNTGNEYHGYVKDFNNKNFEIYIEQKIFKEKNKNKVEIAFSICKNPCSDLIVQKLTELGVDSIQPVLSKNSIFNQKKIDFDKKLKHWESISISSSEQSERLYLPNIKSIISFQDYVEKCNYESKIILDTRSDEMLSSVYTNNLTSCSLLVGPEGDFTDQEYKYAYERNFSSASLGDNILRVETAVIAAFSYIKLKGNNITS